MSWAANAYAKSLKKSADGKERISRSEKFLALTLSTYYNEEVGGMWPGHDRLASDTEHSTRQVERLMASLERKGIIRCWPKAVVVHNGDGQGRPRNFYTFPAVPGAYSQEVGPHIVIRYGVGNTKPDILTGQGHTQPDINGEANPTFSDAHNKEVTRSERERARAEDSPPVSLSEDDAREVADVEAALRRARFRAAGAQFLSRHWRPYRLLAALCHKAGNARQRAVLTDRQKKVLVETLVEMVGVGCDLSRIPTFANNWRDDWKSREGKVQPTPAQVREFWLELSGEGEGDAGPTPPPAEDKEDLKRTLRSGGDWK